MPAVLPDTIPDASTVNEPFCCFSAYMPKFPSPTADAAWISRVPLPWLLAKIPVLPPVTDAAVMVRSSPLLSFSATIPTPAAVMEPIVVIDTDPPNWFLA